MPSSSKCILSLRSQRKTLYAPLLPHTFQSLPLPHFRLLDSINQITFSQQYWSLSYPLCSLLQSTVSQFLSTTNISLSTLFSHTLSLCSSLRIRQHFYVKIKTDKVIFLFILICIYFDSKMEENIYWKNGDEVKGKTFRDICVL